MKNQNTITIVTNTIEHTETSDDNYSLKEIANIALSLHDTIKILLNNEDITESVAQYYCENLYDEDNIPEFVLDSLAYKDLEHNLWLDVHYGSYEDQHRLNLEDVI